MDALPATGDLESLVVRTDFGSDAAWSDVRHAITRPALFRANVKFVDDQQYEGLTPEQVFELVPAELVHTFIFFVDREAIARLDHPILVIDLFEVPGRTFRVIPSQMWAVQNNLVIGNADWDDFASALDEDGVFRAHS